MLLHLQQIPCPVWLGLVQLGSLLPQSVYGCPVVVQLGHWFLLGDYKLDSNYQHFYLDIPLTSPQAHFW